MMGTYCLVSSHLDGSSIALNETMIRSSTIAIMRREYTAAASFPLDQTNVSSLRVHRKRAHCFATPSNGHMGICFFFRQILCDAADRNPAQRRAKEPEIANRTHVPFSILPRRRDCAFLVNRCKLQSGHVAEITYRA